MQDEHIEVRECLPLQYNVCKSAFIAQASEY